MKPWNKGKTKYTHPGIMKIANTMAEKHRSNFWKWQQLHKPQYRILEHGVDLAELYGTLLGDGCIERLARTEKLVISFNRNEQEHIAHVTRVMYKLFGKQPTRRVRKHAQCDDLYLYQKFLSQRLKFPCGEKLKHTLLIPHWIKQSLIYLRHCLKGLFETDGNWAVDRKNYTNVIKFTNYSDTLLEDVFVCLQRLGYHPQQRQHDVRLARHLEVERFVKWIKFRQYHR